MTIQTHSGPCRMCGENTLSRYDRDGFLIWPALPLLRGDTFLCGECKRALRVNRGEEVGEVYDREGDFEARCSVRRYE